MLYDLLRVIPAAILAGVLPGWFWAECLSTPADRATRLAFSVAFSITLVPLAAIAGARLFGTGVTLPIAAASALLVFAAGLAAYLRFGPAKAPGEPIAQAPTPPGLLTMTLLIPALAVALGAAFGVLPFREAALLFAPLALFAGAVHLVEVRRDARLPPPRESSGEIRRSAVAVWARRLSLPAVLLLTLLRGYLGPVLYDWPYLRGIDQYIQAGMSNLMLSEGNIEAYMVYPPGFHAMTAVISRLSTLEPLEVFPVLGPALLVPPALALYALATRLWGWQYGVAAAFFSGVILASSYQYLSEARFPQLISAQFLTVLALAALFRLYASPSIRAGLSFALVGSSVVLFHHVGAFFFALLLAAVSFTVLPYLLLRDRGKGLPLLLSLTLLGLLSVLYAWDTYDLPSVVAGVFSGGPETGATRAAVTGAIGTQQPYELSHLPRALSPAALWLGLLGLALLLADRWRPGGYALARLTILLWGVIMFVGSRTSLGGFPERFERDLGVPLALLAAFAFVRLLRSVKTNTSAARLAALVAVSVAVVLVGWQARHNLEEDGGPPPQSVSATARVSMRPEIEAAGEWLEENNEGGNIIVTPYIDGVPSRAMLAMGGYFAVQTFTEDRIQLNRDLPPSGQEPPTDALRLLKNPASEEARRIIEEYDVRYIVLYKNYFGSKWREFESLPQLYRKTFENDTVVIYEPRE